jgi:membrane-associated phospholipid phosphatase
MASENLRRSTLRRSVRLGLGAGIETLAAGTAWARVEAGAHYPSDVLAGAALGRFVSVLLHDAFLDSSTPPIVSLELAPDRQAMLLRLRF